MFPNITLLLNTYACMPRIINPHKYLANFRVRLIICSVICGGKYCMVMCIMEP